MRSGVPSLHGLDFSSLLMSIFFVIAVSGYGVEFSVTR